MKKIFYLIITLSLYLVVTPAFQCGRPLLRDNCTEYIKDTAMFPFMIANSNPVYRVNDTVRLFSVVSDTIQSVKGKSFVYPINYLNNNIQAYKIINPGISPQLNYANIEFNPLLTEGQFQNSPSLGINVVYNRVQPFNRLQAALVAGTPGLYIVTLNSNSYSNGYYLTEPNNNCRDYTGIYFIPQQQQQKQYWDSIGTTSLRLAGSNNYVVAAKDERNYFFVKVNP